MLCNAEIKVTEEDSLKKVDFNSQGLLIFTNFLVPGVYFLPVHQLCIAI